MKTGVCQGGRTAREGRDRKSPPKRAFWLESVFFQKWVPLKATGLRRASPATT